MAPSPIDSFRTFSGDVSRGTVLAVLVGAYVSYFITKTFILPRFSPVRKIPGPPADHWLFGSMKERYGEGGEEWALKNTERYGLVWRYKGFLGQNRLYVADPRTLYHVLNSADTLWEVPAGIRTALNRSMLSETGAYHRKLRRGMAPFFTPQTLKSTVPITQQIYGEVEGLWDGKMNGDKTDAVNVDAPYWMRRFTQEVIGRAGIGYSFDLTNSWVPKNNEYSEAIGISLPLLIFWGHLLPGVRWLRRYAPRWTYPIAEHYSPFPTLRKVMWAIRIMSQTSVNLVKRKQEDIDQGISDSVAGGKDIITLALKASKNPKAEARLTPDDCVGQTFSLVRAGHETTASTLTMMLSILAQDQKLQDRLRAEVVKAYEDSRGEVSYEQNHALPFLDAFIKETIRLHPIVTEIWRVVSRDDVIPLSSPIKGTDGKSITALPVKKGQTVDVGIVVVNRRNAIGGIDPSKYVPERFIGHETAAQDVNTPGIFANLLSFGAGEHHCIGFRFALNTIKTFLPLFLRSWKIALQDDVQAIRWASGPPKIPIVVYKDGHQEKHILPVQLRRITPQAL